MVCKASVRLKDCSCSEIEAFFKQHKFTGYHVRHITGEIQTFFPEKIAEGENQALIIDKDNVRLFIYNGKDHNVIKEFIELLSTIEPNDPSKNSVLSYDISCHQ